MDKNVVGKKKIAARAGIYTAATDGSKSFPRE